ncbi:MULTISPECIES: DUF4180 domain-containing protein [unclassified Nonomuraea]|uniref:DUF4180 domain-containing protein n=1 Tax=unclassified Nonomuraea TaxID=2593643 RepID=UPI0033D50D2A
MPDTLQHVAGTPVLVCAADGEPLRGEREAVDLLGEAFSCQATWVAIPAERLGEGFFRLRTRVAGEILQKFANYRLGVAVVGDISHHVEASTALRDFVVESNRGRHVWFVPDLEALRERLDQA